MLNHILTKLEESVYFSLKIKLFHESFDQIEHISYDATFLNLSTCRLLRSSTTLPPKRKTTKITYGI